MRSLKDFKKDSSSKKISEKKNLIIFIFISNERLVQLFLEIISVLIF